MTRRGLTRRGRGQGSVRLRGPTWEIGYRPHPGAKQIWERVGSASEGVTEEMALERLRERLAESGRVSAAPTLEAAAREWLAFYRAKPGPTARTVEQHETNLRVHLLPALGQVLLRDLDFSLIEDYWVAKARLAPGEEGCPPVSGPVASARQRPLSARALQLHLGTLNLVLRRAQKRGLLTNNPLSHAERPQVREAKPEPFERDEVRAILGALRDEEQELQVLLQVALGLRIGEVFAIGEQHFDPGQRFLRIRRTLTKVGGKTLISDYTKNDAGRRDLKLSPSLAHRLERQLRRKRAAPSNGSDLLLPNLAGNPIAESNWRQRVWLPALSRAGLRENARPYRLRHTAASEMIAKEPYDPPTLIAYRLGHRVETLLSTYAHIFARHRNQIADLGELYSDAEDEG